MVVIQAREWIGLLPGERFGRAQRADRVARRAVRRVKLLAGDGAGGQNLWFISLFPLFV